MRRRIIKATERWRSERFITLTLADDGRTLAERLDRLYAAFKRLRDTALWRDCVVSGIAACEVTLGRNRQWHTHLHVLVCGEFIPHARLKSEWHKATGDSFIVHIKQVPDRCKAAAYIADYMGKPPPLHTLADAEIVEYATALHGRRLLLTVGKRPESVSEEDDKADTREPSKFVVSVNHVERAELEGIEQVSHAADILSRMSASLAFALDRPPASDTLPPVRPEEFRWAVHVMHETAAAFPALPDAAMLENARRVMFGEPAPPVPRRLTQLRFQYAGPGVPLGD